MTFDDLNVNASKLLDYKLNLDEETDLKSVKLCKNYSVYGYCNLDACGKSHDIELILKNDLMRKEKLNLQKLKAIQESDTKNDNKEASQQLSSATMNNVHTAGLDAFMTGFIMLNYVNKFSKFVTKEESTNQVISGTINNVVPLKQFSNLDEFNFNVYLTGKDYPLIIKKSNFASTSLNHQEKKQRTMSNK